MLSFHNDPAIKARYLDRISASLAAGRLGLFEDWEADHAYPVSLTLDDEDSDFSWYERDLGLPVWLAVIEDGLFLAMPQDRASTWPRDFLAAIPIGISEDRFDREVKAPFLVMLLDTARASIDRNTHWQLDHAIVRAIALWQRDDLFERPWLAELEQVSDLAWSLLGDYGTPASKAAMLTSAVTVVEGCDADEHMVDSLQHADPGRFDHLAAEMLKLLERAAPRRTGNTMLAAIRAAS